MSWIPWRLKIFCSYTRIWKTQRIARHILNYKNLYNFCIHAIAFIVSITSTSCIYTSAYFKRIFKRVLIQLCKKFALFWGIHLSLNFRVLRCISSFAVRVWIMVHNEVGNTRDGFDTFDVWAIRKILRIPYTPFIWPTLKSDISLVASLSLTL